MKVSLLKNCFLLRGEAKVSLIASLITDGGTDDEEEEGRCQKNKTVTQHLPETIVVVGFSVFPQRQHDIVATGPKSSRVDPQQ